MDIAPELVRGTDEQFNTLGSYFASLTPSATDAESGTFFHIVTAIGSATLKNYEALRKAFEAKDQTISAWSCRNLLELLVFMRFVLESKANAMEFAGHRLIDVEEIAKKLRQLEFYIDSSRTSSNLDPQIEQVTLQMAAEGVPTSRFLSARDLIRRTPKSDAISSEEFDIVNKVCSKYVHPSAWSLMTADNVAEQFPGACNLFYGLGAKYMLATLITARAHIRANGLNHKA